MEIRPSRNILLFNCQGKSGFVKSRDDIHVPTSPANIMLDGNNEPVLVRDAPAQKRPRRLGRSIYPWHSSCLRMISILQPFQDKGAAPPKLDG